MFRATAVYLVVFLGFAISGFRQVSKADDTTAERSVDAKLLTSQLIETFDLILANHVSPPTMQQMVQESIAALHSAANAHVPAALAKELSNATGDSLRSILERELSKVGSEGTTLSDCIPHELASIGVTVTPMKAQVVNEQIAANRYVGIGIAIQSASGKTTMAKIFPDGPADQAGAEDGDVIIEVDGKSTTGVQLNQVIDWIRGVRGSKVRLLTRRNGTDHTLTMTRDIVSTTEPDYEPLEHEFPNAIRQIVECMMKDEVPKIASVANALGTSVRTLQRRLSDIDESFTGILETARLTSANRLIANGDLSLNQISQELGYSDQAHFTRAFRRWTGISPAAYRRLEETFE